MLVLDGDRLVGWAERGSAARDLTTPQGLRLQSSTQDLRAALPDVQVRGADWSSATGMSGRLDGTGRVSELRAGVTCGS